MKTGVLPRRPVPMGDTERHAVVRFNLPSAVLAKYFAIVHESKSEK